MPLNWAGVFTSGGDMPSQQQKECRDLLDGVADAVEAYLAGLGFPPHVSPLFQPFHLLAVADVDRLLALFSRTGGAMSSMLWLDFPAGRMSRPEAYKVVEQRLGREVHAAIEVPWDLPNRYRATQQAIAGAAMAHVNEVEMAQALAKVGDLTGMQHLVGPLRRFLADHSEPARNVFIMMRFHKSDQFDAIHETIKATLTEKGLKGIRADDRDYTGDVWTNVEVQMVGCRYGVAVFEDMEDRSHNPNVAMELGFMSARRSRCLILKEKRLPVLPTDIVGKLYKPFDQFDIEATVRAQVLRWIEVDLGL
jgi:hypothetical protein